MNNPILTVGILLIGPLGPIGFGTITSLDTVGSHPDASEQLMHVPVVTPEPDPPIIISKEPPSPV